MPTTLIALHGFTQNGATLREALQPLSAQWPASVRLECPDGIHVCAEASVARLHALLGGPRASGPHYAWFDATDDGREYRGFDASEARLRAIVERARSAGEGVGLLGFSQGAIAATCLAALAAHGRFPKLDFAILVAGRTPRADIIAPLLVAPIALPSLHVWGSRDPLSKAAAPALAERFDSSVREIATWSGPHVLPTRGEGAEAITGFVTRAETSWGARASVGE